MRYEKFSEMGREIVEEAKRSGFFGKIEDADPEADVIDIVGVSISVTASGIALRLNVPGIITDVMIEAVGEERWLAYVSKAGKTVVRDEALIGLTNDLDELMGGVNWKEAAERAIDKKSERS